MSYPQRFIVTPLNEKSRIIIKSKNQQPSMKHLEIIQTLNFGETLDALLKRRSLFRRLASRLIGTAVLISIKLTHSDLSASLKWIICRADYTSILNTPNFVKRSQKFICSVVNAVSITHNTAPSRARNTF